MALYLFFCEMVGSLLQLFFYIFVIQLHYRLNGVCTANDILESSHPHVPFLVCLAAQNELSFLSHQHKNDTPIFFRLQLFQLFAIWNKAFLDRAKWNYFALRCALHFRIWDGISLILYHDVG